MSERKKMNKNYNLNDSILRKNVDDDHDDHFRCKLVMNHKDRWLKKSILRQPSVAPLAVYYFFIQ